MTREEREQAIAILENEKKCVNRANKNDYCNRDCYNCELVKTDTEILIALDMAIQALEQSMPTMVYPQVDGITPTVVAQADGEKTCGTCRNEDTYHCAECENKSDYEQAQADREYITQSAGDEIRQKNYDSISRQAVLDYIYNDLGLGDEENGKDLERQMDLVVSYKYVKSLPPVTPQPKTGHWIKYGKIYQCSECEELSCCQGKFCNECGAKMVEPQEGENE